LESSFVIISACLPFLDSYQNHVRTCELRQELLDKGIPFDGLSQVRNGKTEASFIVVTSSPNPYLPLAQKFGQKSVLFRDKAHTCQEVFVAKDTPKKELGKVVASTETLAKKAEFHLCVQDVSCMRYFTLEQSVN
jgi:hypothetical protein